MISDCKLIHNTNNQITTLQHEHFMAGKRSETPPTPAQHPLTVNSQCTPSQSPPHTPLLSTMTATMVIHLFAACNQKVTRHILCGSPYPQHRPHADTHIIHRLRVIPSAVPFVLLFDELFSLLLCFVGLGDDIPTEIQRAADSWVRRVVVHGGWLWHRDADMHTYIHAHSWHTIAFPFVCYLQTTALYHIQQTIQCPCSVRWPCCRSCSRCGVAVDGRWS